MMKQSIVITLVLLLSCGSIFAANGNFGGGNGSEASPFVIEDAADLFAVNQHLSAAYILAADIDLAGYSFNQAPIAPGTNMFRGYFNGNGRVIRNLTIQGDAYIGLFGYLYHGTITDLGVEDVDINGSNRVGALAGKSKKGTMIRCYSTGQVHGYEAVGGLVGHLSAYTWSYWWVFQNRGPSRLLNCYSHASVSGDNRLGGLVGDSNRSEIRNCYSTGNVGGPGNQGMRVGGLIGRHYENLELLRNCYSTGTVNGNYYVGGFIGEDLDADDTDQINCFWNTETSGTTTGCGNTSVPGLFGITNALMAQQSTFSEWDFVDDWQISTYYNRPLLKDNPEPAYYNVTVSAGANGTVSPIGSSWYEKAEPLLLTASPTSGYVVDDWYVGSTLAQSGGMTYSVGPVLADMDLSVTFKPAVLYCNVTISHGADGSVSPLGIVQIERGDELTIVAYPDYRYEVEQWKLNGSVYQYGLNTFTLHGTQTNTGSVTVDVSFEPIMYTVHISSGIPVGNGDVRIGNHGSTDPNGYQPVQQGGSLTITAYPQTGYEVDTWQVNGVLCNQGQTTYDLQNVSGNMTIGVLFKNSVFTNGNGTVYDPYLVHDVATLNAVNDEPAAHYIMTNDIDLSGQPDYTDAVIGIDATAPFLGVFDGNHKKITGLTIDSVNNYLGLFGVISSANGLQGQVSNLTIEGATVRSDSSNVGVLCGLNQSGIIEKCRVVGVDVTGDERVAGLCGYNSNGTIRYSSAEGSVTGSYRVGLLTGNCYLGTISNCYAIGTLTMEGAATSGGGISGDINQATISNSYASCSINGTGQKLGSFCGWSQSSSYDDCVTNRETYDVAIGETDGGDVGTIAGLGQSQMRTMEYWALTDWDFVGNSSDGIDDIWRMCQDGFDFPRLWWQFGPGDIACGDGVNFVDFAILGQNWFTSEFESGFYDNADINGDGVIETEDLLIFVEHWLD